MTELEYYDNPSNHGSYQYLTLTELINNYMMSRGSDNHTAMTPRHIIIYQFKRGIRELYYDVVKEINRVEIDVSSTLQVILPPNYVNMVRLSSVDEYGKLHPLAVDSRTSIARAYLQDNDYNILFDNEGESLETVPDNLKPSKPSRHNSYMGFTPNKNLSNSFPDGSYNIDKQEGVIHFSSDIEFKRVSLEYISDGLYLKNENQDEDNIRIHKFAESALLDYVYYQLCKNSMRVPANEKQRAKKEYFNSRRIAKRRVNSLTLKDIYQVFKSDSKWIKGN